MRHGGDVIAELTTDHREVEELVDRIEALPSGDSRRKDYADQAIMELVRHSVAEESYLYPTVRKQLPNGDALADQELRDHATIERTLKDLERREADDPRFDTLMMRLMAEVREHVADEENDIFPQLRAACTPDMLAKLGDQVRSAKKSAPTRPHPSAPGTPPANELPAPGMGFVDRMRDMMTGRGES